MQTFATGAAFVDRAGVVAGADAGFIAQLGLAAEDPSGALKALAESRPEVRALLAGEGPTVIRVPGPDGAEVELERVAAEAGMLLLTRAPSVAEWLEHAMRSQGLTRLAAGLAHDIKNPLNAMALQLALLADKLSASPEASSASASHLGALREQIGRVNEVVRRFLDVTDPSAPLGYTDLGALVGDTASLFGHDARRRRVDLAVESSRGSVRTRCEPGRVGRLVLALFSHAMATTPEGGRLSVHAEAGSDGAVVSLEHVSADPEPGVAYDMAVMGAAAMALGGGLEVGHADGAERLVLRLPRNDRT
jgi:signal transduction histidine kinase